MFLKISQNSRESTCARVSFFIKLQVCKPATLLKKKLWHRCFPVNFMKFLKTFFFHRTPPVAASKSSKMLILILLLEGKFERIIKNRKNDCFEKSEVVVRRCSVKKMFLEISQNSQENTCVRDSFLIKLQALACNFIEKESLAQVFSCEFCEISKNTFFYRTPPVAVL